MSKQLNMLLRQLINLHPKYIDLSLSRITSKDRMESAGRKFLLKVKNGFLELAKSNKNRYVIIDANKTIPEIQDSIWNEFFNRHLK